MGAERKRKRKREESGEHTGEVASAKRASTVQSVSAEAPTAAVST